MVPLSVIKKVLALQLGLYMIFVPTVYNGCVVESFDFFVSLTPTVGLASHGKEHGKLEMRVDIWNSHGS